MGTIFKLSWRILIGNHSAFTRTVSFIAFGSALLGACALFCSIAILEGFRKEISNQVYNRHGHFQLLPANSGQGGAFLKCDSEQLASIQKLPSVSYVRPFLQLPALIKTEQDGEGIVLKTHIRRPLTPPKDSTIISIAINSKLGQKLALNKGDEAVILLLTPDPSYRKVRVDSIWKGSVDELDAITAFCAEAPLRYAARIAPDVYSEIEVFAPTVKMNDIDDLQKQFYAIGSPEWMLLPTRELSAEIFDWLDVIGRNVDVILLLIISVVSINCAGTILIYILDKMSTIGLLKSLGGQNGQLRQLFWNIGTLVAAPGLLLGFCLGYALCSLQARFHFVKLNPENYYLESVPISLDPGSFAFPLGALISVLLLSQVLPALIAQRVTPTAALKQQY